MSHICLSFWMVVGLTYQLVSALLVPATKATSVSGESSGT